MSARVKSGLVSLLQRANTRGFVFDVTELAEFPGGSFESLLERAGVWWPRSFEHAATNFTAYALSAQFRGIETA